MKSVMISIKPKWCKLIASGEKTVEIRKTRPKLETPFKCYIYETKKTKPGIGFKFIGGKVIGEFVCDEIVHIESRGTRYITAFGEAETNRIARESRLDFLDMQKYLGSKDGFAWHISDLVIYDEPKELSEFWRSCGDNPKCEGCEAHYFSNTECGREEYCCSSVDGCKPITRPPQSWCYVVRLEETK